MEMFISGSTASDLPHRVIVYIVCVNTGQVVMDALCIARPLAFELLHFLFLFVTPFILTNVSDSPTSLLEVIIFLFSSPSWADGSDLQWLF